MRVLIDGTPLLLPTGGVRNYVANWITHLRAAAPPGDRIDAFPCIRNVSSIDPRASSSKLRLRFVQVANLGSNPLLDAVCGRADIFHESNTHVLNPPRRAKLTATLHDLTCWLMPEVHTAANVAAAKLFADRILKRADALIAVSKNTRADAVRILGIPFEKIQVIYPGVCNRFFDVPAAELDRLRTSHNLPNRYILFLGVLEPRKNLLRLIEGYSQLPAEIRSECSLLLAGPAGWKAEPIFERVGSVPGVRYIGYVPEPNMPALMAGATVFAYPSLYEGFGFPVVEAMAAGVPVLTSNCSSLPEITGGAAMLVDPRSPAGIRDGLFTLLTSPVLRDDLIERGKRNASACRWGKCAAESLEFFRQALSR